MHESAAQSKVTSDASSLPAAPSRFLAWLIAILLGLIVIALYWPATSNVFLNYDDDVYITANAHVQAGLTAENIKWAFLNIVSANWHPLTMMSHMLDCQFYGLKPWGHHLTNILLHALDTVLAFLLLRNMTGALWRSAMVAALFGIHPLHVQSVAWVAERKDVLSTFFGLLSLLVYVGYVQKCPKTNHSVLGSRFAAFNYFLALLFFALGLMSKAMLVTLPCLMLLLDYWPLKRNSAFLISDWKHLLLEKIPFFALAAAASVMTFLVQKQSGAVMEVGNYPMGDRIANALISYCRYLGKLFYPTDLAVFYPHVVHWPPVEVLSACVLLCGITVLFFRQRRSYPFLLMGWLWFVGTLVPVIGLVQVGEQSMADRYTYIPSLGIFILVIWGAYELTKYWRYQMIILSTAGSAAVILCVVVTRQQLGYWKESETLFRHALAVTDDNELAETNLGLAVLAKGRFDEAIRRLQDAANLTPDYAEVHNNLGNAYLNKGLLDKAIDEFEEAIGIKPSYVKAHANIGLAFFQKGDYDDAINHFQEAINLDPDFPGLRVSLGVAFLRKGQVNQAIGQFQEAIRHHPNDSNAYFNLGVGFFDKGQMDEAISQFQETLRLNPKDIDAKSRLIKATEFKQKLDALGSNPAALNNWAWELATSPDQNVRDGAFAVQLAERACEVTHYRVTVIVGTLAAAYAEMGRFDDAISTAQKACILATEMGNTDLLKKNQELLALYQAHQPYHEPAGANQ